jgi:hypothetical protein
MVDMTSMALMLRGYIRLSWATFHQLLGSLWEIGLEKSVVVSLFGFFRYLLAEFDVGGTGWAFYAPFYLDVTGPIIFKVQLVDSQLRLMCQISTHKDFLSVTPFFLTLFILVIVIFMRATLRDILIFEVIPWVGCVFSICLLLLLGGLR